MASTVGVLFKVYPAENEAEAVAQRIKDEMKPQSIAIDEIGFGIKILKPFFTFDDKTNTSMKIEEQLKKIKGVSEVEVIEESLL